MRDCIEDANVKAVEIDQTGDAQRRDHIQAGGRLLAQIDILRAQLHNTAPNKAARRRLNQTIDSLSHALAQHLRIGRKLRPPIDGEEFIIRRLVTIVPRVTGVPSTPHRQAAHDWMSSLNNNWDGNAYDLCRAVRREMKQRKPNVPAGTFGLRVDETVQTSTWDEKKNDWTDDWKIPGVHDDIFY